MVPVRQHLLLVLVELLRAETALGKLEARGFLFLSDASAAALVERGSPFERAHGLRVGKRVRSRTILDR